MSFKTKIHYLGYSFLIIFLKICLNKFFKFKFFSSFTPFVFYFFINFSNNIKKILYIFLIFNIINNNNNNKKKNHTPNRTLKLDKASGPKHRYKK